MANTQCSSNSSSAAGPFATIEALANREIARRIVAAIRDGNPQTCWQSGERLIAGALDDAQLVGEIIEHARQRQRFRGYGPVLLRLEPVA
jgi:hypothetical protein